MQKLFSGLEQHEVAVYDVGEHRQGYGLKTISFKSAAIRTDEHGQVLETF